MASLGPSLRSSLGSIWNPDLSVRLGAQSAADMGGFASFAYAALCVITIAVTSGVVNYTAPLGMVILAILGTQAVIAVITGFRLRAQKGAFWGIGLLVIMALELIGKLISLDIGVGFIFSVILMILVLQGVRAAFALRRGDEFDDEDAAAFE